jgi:hypothetical protein
MPIFAITPAELVPILDEASRYLERRSRRKIATGSVKTLGNEAKSIYQELLELEEQTAKLNARHEYLESSLKVLIGKTALLEGIASWRTRISTSLDRSALKREAPWHHALLSVS